MDAVAQATARLLERVRVAANESETARIEDALRLLVSMHKEERREDGSAYPLHPIAVAEILLEWGADPETVCAGLLHDIIEDSEITNDVLAARFGAPVAALVQGVTKFTNADLAGQVSLDRKIETLRRLFEVMREDIRVLIIKLADRLHNVRTMDVFPPDRAKRFARETLDIYYKLAWHLGMNDLRREFSNRCTPYAYPEDAALLMNLRKRMEQEGRTVCVEMQRRIHQEDTAGLLQTGRLEMHSLASLVRDRHKPEFSDEQVFYIVLLARDDAACYGILQILHGLYRPRSGQFRDYIAAPSTGGYKSLHTTVIDQAGRIIDVRIRTSEMDEHERSGVLHRCFSGQLPDEPGFAWLRRSERIDQATRQSSSEFWDALQSDIFPETMQVVVDGRTLTLPRGATVLDAAYARYAAGAHRAVSVTRNGNPGYFGDPLQTDDVITCAFSASTLVSFEWLKCVATRYARSLITAALKERSKEEQLLVGKQLLQREFDHYGKGLVAEMSRTQEQNVASYFHRNSFDDVLIMVGAGVILPRDVVFYLFPLQRRRFWHASEESQYKFCLSVRGAGPEQRDVVQKLSALAVSSDVEIRSADVKTNPRSKSFDVVLRGVAPSRAGFANFLTMLERQDWISMVQSRLSLAQRMFLMSALLCVATIIIADVLLLPYYQDQFLVQTGIYALAFQLLPILPVLAANYYLLNLLRNYLVRLRQDRWFLGLGFVLNIFGILLVLWKLPLLREQSNVYPFVFLFAVSMLLLSFRYAKTYFALEPKQQASDAQVFRPINIREKIAGYMLRFCAVLIWGIEPVFIRYSAMQDLHPLLRVHVWGIVGGLCGIVTIFGYNLCTKKAKRLRYTTSYNWLFAIIVVANISYNFFLHSSLLFTTATNVNLALGYAPIFSLLLAFVIWRKRIPYFQSPVAMQQMLLVFGLSALGGSLLFLSDIQRTNEGVFGDMLALMIAFSDVAFMMANIYYVKYSNALTNTLALTTQHLLWIGLITGLMIPLVNFFLDSGITYATVTPAQWTASVALGVITMIGFVLTFEAFRRIDGLLAFLMLNLAPVIAFVPEFFVFGIRPQPFFFLGAALILSASILAEFVNMRSERRTIVG